MAYWDVLWWQGDWPQDWPPGPIIPAYEGYLLAGTPTPIGNQENVSPPSATPPPNNPSELPGVPFPIGPIGPVIVPPTFIWFV